MSFDKPIITDSFYFNTDNVDMLLQRLKGKAKISYEIENFDCGECGNLLITMDIYCSLDKNRRNQKLIKLT